MFMQESSMVIHGRNRKGPGSDQVKYTLTSNGLPLAKAESKESREVKAVISTLVIFVVAGSTAGVLGWFFYSLDTPRSIMLLDGLHVQLTNHRYVEFMDANMMPLLKGNMGTTFDANFVNYDFQERDDYSTRMVLVNHAEFSVKLKLLTSHIRAYHINWTAKSCIHGALEDCFHLPNYHWYGIGEMHHQKWPLEGGTLPDIALTPGIHPNSSLGGIQERYFLLSSGVAIVAKWDIPLWVSINATKMDRICLKSSFHPHFYPHYNASIPLTLQYTVYVGPDIKTTHSYITRHVFHKPKNVPRQYLFNRPSWTVIVGDKKNQGPSVIRYAQQISKHDFRGALLFLRFHTTSSSPMKRDTSGFNVQDFQMAIGELRRLGFCPTMTLSPLALLPSYTSRLGITDAFLTVDNIYAVAAKWYMKILKDYKQKGICSGAIYMLQNPKVSSNFKLPFEVNKLRLFQSLANISSSVFPDTVFSTASDIRDRSNFIQMKARYPHWGSDGGLKSIIPEALTLGLIGYPFIMSPGLGMFNDSKNSTSLPDKLHKTSGLPDKTLYLRWLGIVTFFPSIHFTTPPWYYDANVTEYAKNFLLLHKNFVPTIIQKAQEATRTGSPILRPVWWISPGDHRTFSLDDQFLLGDDLLVAPVVEPGATKREIYIPSGEWWDNLRHSRIIGGGWLHSYKASLHELPHFTRIQGTT